MLANQYETLTMYLKELDLRAQQAVGMTLMPIVPCWVRQLGDMLWYSVVPSPVESLATPSR